MIEFKQSSLDSRMTTPISTSTTNMTTKLVCVAILLIIGALHLVTQSNAARFDCISKPVAGNCKAAKRRWNYDPTNKTCTIFKWGGCTKGSNGNRYKTRRKCEKVCDKMDKAKGMDCHSEPVAGHCKAAIPRWNYDPQHKKCKMFIWGGCKRGSNGNRYETEQLCREACSNKDYGTDCHSKPVAEHCKAAIPRWNYDPQHKKCKMFLWGGCKRGSNGNRYTAKQQCRDACIRK